MHHTSIWIKRYFWFKLKAVKNALGLRILRIMMLTWRILMLTLRMLMLTLRKLICKDTDANILLVTQQTFLIFQDVFKTSWRRLQRNTFCLPWPLLKTSSRRLQDVLEDKKMLQRRRLEDVLKTSSVRLHQDECLLGNICWFHNKILHYLCFSSYLQQKFLSFINW